MPTQTDDIFTLEEVRDFLQFPKEMQHSMEILVAGYVLFMGPEVAGKVLRSLVAAADELPGGPKHFTARHRPLS